MNLDKLKFPIGEFNKPNEITDFHITEWLEVIKEFPNKLDDLTKNLNSEELNLIYRPGGWNIKQVVHHCADSHMNAFIRFKLTLTENSPHIKPYQEDKWAEMTDVIDQPISDSISILRGVHSRWVTVIRSMLKTDFSRLYVHSEYNREYVLDECVGLYAWHCKHHKAHIEQALRLRERF